MLIKEGILICGRKTIDGITIKEGKVKNYYPCDFIFMIENTIKFP